MQVTIIKIGGNIIDDAVRLQSFLKDFAALQGHKILVHGGGKLATDMSARLGIESQYVSGRRVTDKETLEVVTMVYGGLINKNIVATLQSIGCNALGLTGADANVIQAVRRPVKEVDYGFVGDVHKSGVNTTILTDLLQQGLTLVMAPLTHDGNGTMLNTNADTIAQEVAKALAVTMNVKLVYCFEKKGVLQDADNDDSVISRINKPYFQELKEKEIVSGGMIPKLENALTAVDSGVNSVIIGMAEELQQLIDGTTGTHIV